VKWSDDVSNMVSNITRRYIDHMKFTTYKTVSIIRVFHIILVLFFSIIIWLYALYASV
jgi:hypothetical protein